MDQHVANATGRYPVATHTVKMTGTIKWINEAKTFGLITPDDGSEDLFASFSVRKDGDQSDGLKVKQKVSYDVEPGHHGGRAVNVETIPGGEKISARRRGSRTSADRRDPL